MRDHRERLRDILESIEHIERYSSKGRAACEADELIQSWFVRHLQIIGEAARTIPDTVRAQAPEIPWSDIVGMRHVLVHDYFGIDREAVWSVVDQQLPALKQEIRKLLERPT